MCVYHQASVNCCAKSKDSEVVLSGLTKSFFNVPKGLSQLGLEGLKIQSGKPATQRGDEEIKGCVLLNVGRV